MKRLAFRSVHFVSLGYRIPVKLSDRRQVVLSQLFQSVGCIMVGLIHRVL
jgi:hypothetical protein